MAIAQEIDEDDDAEKAPAKKKTGKGKLLLIIFSALFLVGGGTAVALYFSGSLDGLFPSDGERPSENSKAVAKKPPIYISLGDAFVVNFVDANQIRYLQVNIEAMTRDPSVSGAIDAHLPKIRNNLVFMFSGFDYASLGTIEGKRKIQQEALAELQQILKEEIGNTGVEAVYFTSFVMQ